MWTPSQKTSCGASAIYSETTVHARSKGLVDVLGSEDLFHRLPQGHKASHATRTRNRNAPLESRTLKARSEIKLMSKPN